MATASELILEKQLRDLRQNADIHDWLFDLVDPTTFVIGLPAKDESDLALFVKCNDYPVQPPAWHWHNRASKAIDTPLGGDFFHNSGVICASWNRLAYRRAAATTFCHMAGPQTAAICGRHRPFCPSCKDWGWVEGYSPHLRRFWGFWGRYTLRDG